MDVKQYENVKYERHKTTISWDTLQPCFGEQWNKTVGIRQTLWYFKGASHENSSDHVSLK